MFVVSLLKWGKVAGPLSTVAGLNDLERNAKPIIITVKVQAFDFA